MDARQRSNPFETIKGTIFQNRYWACPLINKAVTLSPGIFRAAMKMANIDAVFDFMFTSPKKSDGVSMNMNE